MRRLALVPLILSLAACGNALLPPQGGVVEPTATTPFTWKANTPRVTRAYDINECELAGRGLPVDASADEIAAASAESNPDQVAAFVRRCLSNKGYIQTELPVCNDSLRRQGSLVVAPDVLPPLERIRCLDPVARGMVVV
ncbi:hypothetical protein HMH01_16075 [Halovulum dunhuangense]|uniref:Lipoprotein n=1 Tax=Halovulum dunhuangense TaxID=1505036 RepID=A0A849L695_9RHOB|nr:hypothetical protein [Halovulum dunhuangense]NNU81955.1 hypothetical protein [Halovulum dunhuangense]